MRRLEGLMGELGKFFVQYKDYLGARGVLIRYHLSKKKIYDWVGVHYIPKEVIDAEFTVCLWKDRKLK